MIRLALTPPKPASSLGDQQHLERQVIRASFKDPQFSTDVGGYLVGSDFVNVPLGKLFDFRVGMGEAGENDSAVIAAAAHNAGLLNEIGGILEFERILLEPGDTGHARVYARIVAEYKKQAPRDPKSPAVSALDLFDRFPKKRRAVIEGLLRLGEILNLIAAAKVGKSWMITGALLCVATGRDWLGHRVEQGKVLLIDNELHGEELSSRIQRVASAMGIAHSEIDGMFDVISLRGRLMDIGGVRRLTDSLASSGYSVIAMDAFYRFLPAGTSENDNGQMAALYNGIDAFAADVGCAVILNHHSSKGDQSGKAVTDVGSGAGSMSRAADTHLVIRPHQVEGHAVLDAACRSWPPLEPRSIRWEWPLWHASDLEPVLYQRPKPGARATTATTSSTRSHTLPNPFSSEDEDDDF